MSIWQQTLSGVRKMILVEDRIDRLEKAVDKMSDQVGSQERRLGQLEFIIYGPIPPEQLRIPRT